MTDLTYWLLFFSAAVALNISPGPDLVYILSRSVVHGTRVGLASTLGVCTGAFVHVLAASLGLSAILAASSTAFTAVKYAGAIYLIYLGILSIRSAGSSFNTGDPGGSSISTWQAFRQGIMVDVLNPKVSIFFMAFLPQFVRDGYPPLAGNRTVIMNSSVNLVRIILSGGFAPTTEGNPRPYGMPPFGHTLSDSEVAAVATYVRNAWGHKAGAVMPLDVQKTR